MLVISVTRNFENIHYQYLVGGIPDSAWKGWSYRILNFFEQPGLQTWWEHHKSAYSPDFRDFVERGKGDSAYQATTLLSVQATPTEQ